MREEGREPGKRREESANGYGYTIGCRINSRCKKGQMKSIFLSDSDKEAIVKFVKQHEDLYDKTNDSFKDKQKKEGL